MTINTEKKNIEPFYNQAILFTKSHYENFPVISLFISKELKQHIAIVYQFARQADDIADEGNKNPDLRLEELSNYQKSFENCLNKKYDYPFWRALENTVTTKNLSPDNFLKLISAFKQDIVKKRYYNFDELIDYCKLSANPIGRIILELNRIKIPELMIHSDKICTALQLTNFYQDVNNDLAKNRIYLPQDELLKFKVDENLKSVEINEQFIQFMKLQIERTRTLFKDGYQLLDNLPLNLKYHIKMTIKGGEEILKKIEKNGYDVFKRRPKLYKRNFLSIFLKTVF